MMVTPLSRNLPVPDVPRLERLLGGAPLARLRERLRRRYEVGEPTSDRFTLGQLTPAAAAALAGLLGRVPRPRSSMQLSHAELDAALRSAGVASDLRQALEFLDGPIRDPAAARAQRLQAWAGAFAAAVDSRLVGVLADAMWKGVLKRLAGGDPGRARALVEQADAVLARLPAAGISLARLAASALGDAHALDASQPVGTLVLRAVAAGDRDLRPRELWAGQGVLVNELAKPVATLNLAADGSGFAARLVRLAAAVGEPVHLSLRLLAHRAPAWAPEQRIFVCENPAVLAAAADALGPRCPPMVSIDGQLSAAPRTLLDQLAARGATFRYHGDFDWGGLHIANVLFARYRVLPWRFDAAHYRPTDGPPLHGNPVIASWDAALSPAMRKAGIAIHEESLLDALLADLMHGSNRAA
ncbi:MAG TPA: TIGR02679 family protein [Nevskiaceae bacterium]